ncbi:MAG: VWA domain-containing protein [Deltaproteobacteria bacterium]|nr:VWA domain-containing protein [Deltaproteobacteria bacterium]
MRLGPGTFAAAASVGTGLAGHDGNSRAEFFGNFPAGSAGTRPVDLAGIQPAGLAGNAPADSAGTVAGGRLPGGTVAGWLRENPGAGEVGEGHVDRVAGYVVPERLRRPRPVHARAAVDKTRRAEAAEAEARPSRVLSEPEIPPDFSPEAFDPDEEIRLTVYDAAESFELTTPKVRKEFGNKERSGRRSFRETLKTRGRAYKTTARRLGRPLSLSATLRAAAPRQGARREAAWPAGVSGPAGRSLILKPVDFREKVYRLKTGRLVVFVVDSSGSVGTLYRMEEAKAAALALLAEAYRKRDRVALIAFYGYSAELLLPPTNSPDLAGRLLSSLPSGGKTPMAAALAMTHRLILTERSKDPKISPYVILMTDGRPNIPLDKSQQPWAEVLSMAGRMAQDPTVRFLLVDTDRGAYNDYKLTRELAERLGCPRFNLEELREGRLDDWFEAN